MDKAQTYGEMFTEIGAKNADAPKAGERVAFLQTLKMAAYTPNELDNLEPEKKLAVLETDIVELMKKGMRTSGMEGYNLMMIIDELGSLYCKTGVDFMGQKTFGENPTQAALAYALTKKITANDQFGRELAKFAVWGIIKLVSEETAKAWLSDFFSKETCNLCPKSDTCEARIKDPENAEYWSMRMSYEKTTGKEFKHVDRMAN